MRKRNLQPTVLTIKIPYKGIYAENQVDAMLKALDYFAEDQPATVNGLNDLSENGLVLSDGSEITAFVNTEVGEHPVAYDPHGNHCFWVDIIIAFNYFSVEYCTSMEIIRIFNDMFPHMHLNMFSNSYHIESYHI